MSPKGMICCAVTRVRPSIFRSLPATNRTSRHRVECPATLKVKTRFYFGKLCDLSPTGARVQTRGMIKKPGDAVLALPDLPPLLATIRWVDERDCGLEFRERIPADALSRWLLERDATLEE